MPKRRCPFGESTPLQRKTHVGFKETATQDDMQEVYERTRAMLFQGANPKSPQKMNGVTNGTPHPKQNGVVHQAIASNGVAKAGLVCVCCHRKIGSEGVCSSCDRKICVECLHCCCTCSRRFCQFCSILNYDQTEVRAFCLNCLPVTS